MRSRNKNPAKLSLYILWFDRLMALIALSNLGLVLFDLTYIPWRDTYLRGFWTLQRISDPLKDVNFFQLYDPYKGIEPHRETKKYLDTVESLKSEVASSGLQSPETEKTLQELRQLSVSIIDENPFQLANKTGTLEKIKNLMRLHTFGSKDASSKKSFELFWSQENLRQKGWQQEIEFFERKIKPLIATNYYRQIGENGDFINDFWKIDRWFIGLFCLDILGRTWLISRRNRGLRWIPDALLWRWYDVFLLLPFYQWLRIIPVIVRLNQAKFPDLEPYRSQISRIFIASFAEELTEVVVIQVIDQVQATVKSEEFIRSLVQLASQRYIDINDTNEIEEISKRLLQVTLCKALPQIQIDLQDLLRHNLENTLQQLPIYQQIQRFPGMANFQTQLTEMVALEVSKIVTQTPQNAYNAITSAPPDPVAKQISERLVEHFSQAFSTEIQQKHTLVELQSLVSDLLEEIKINYVKRTPETNHEKILAQTQELRRLAGR